jgi:hypothetical protein
MDAAAVALFQSGAVSQDSRSEADRFFVRPDNMEMILQSI